MSELVNAGNNFMSRLIHEVDPTDTFLFLENYDELPDPPFLLTINNGKETMEIVKVTKFHQDYQYVDCERAQEGTTAQEHEAGSIVENNFTAGTYQALVDEINNLRNNSLIIEEQGKNENGEYIKYTNGRLECFQTIDLGAVGFDSAGDIYRSDGFNWYYPVEFVDNDIYISITSGAASAWVDTSANPPYKERIPFRVFSYNSSSTIIGVSLMAIGRWK